VDQDGDTWEKFRLPKGARWKESEHIWWRIRQIEGYGPILADVYNILYLLIPGDLTEPSGYVLPGQLTPVPVSIHPWSIHDFCSFAGMLAVGRHGLGFSIPDPSNSYEYGTPWAGLDFMRLDALWNFGKPRGYGGVWKDTSVDAGETSDPFLINGFDEAMLHLWTDTAGDFTIEVDPVGDGTWKTYDTVSLSAGEYSSYGFPTEFNAIWVRVSFSRPPRWALGSTSGDL